MPDDVSWKDYVDALRAADIRAWQIDREAQLRALALAARMQEVKDKQTDEIRLRDAENRLTYITKHDHEVLENRLENAVEPLREFMQTSVGRTRTTTQILTFLGALISILITASTVLIILFNH